MKDNIIVRGGVDISIYENEKLIDHIKDENLVVTLGKTNVTKLLGGDAAGKKISKIAVGANNVDPVVADNAITGMFSKALVSVSYPDPQKVMFHFDIDNTEANGITIFEFGLLNDDNVLCARKVRSSSIVKTNTIRLVGTWTLTVN